MKFKSSLLVRLIHLILLHQQAQQIHFRHNRHRLHPILLLLRYHSRAVPLKEPRQRIQRRIKRDLDKLPLLRCTMTIRFTLRLQRRVIPLVAHLMIGRRTRRRRKVSDIQRIRDHLSDLGEAEHDILHRAAACGSTLTDPTEEIAKSHETHESFLGGRREDGELIEPLFAHRFDGFGAGGVGSDGGDRFEAEGADGCGAEGRFVFWRGCLGVTIFGVEGRRGRVGVWWCGWKEIVGCEPVVVGELW